MPPKPDAREIAALDAIIAASLAGRPVDNLSDSELLDTIESCPELSEAGRALLASLGSEPFKLHGTLQTKSEETVVREEFAGMYRQGSDEDLDPEVRKEIESKREELRARLRARGRTDV